MARILFILPSLGGGGAERLTLDLSRALIARGHAIEILTCIDNVAYASEIGDQVDYTPVLSSGQSVWLNIFKILAVATKRAREAEIVVGGLPFLATYIAWIAASCARRRSIAWVHSDLGSMLPMRRAIHHPLSSLVYRSFDKIVMPTYAALESLHATFSISREKTRAVENGLDLGRIGSMREKAATIDTALEKPYILAVGRLSHAKGFDNLLHALATALEATPSINLVIMGEGEDRDALEVLVRELGIGGAVQLPGFVQNPYPIMASARGLILSSRTEGFGLVLVEAMYLGVPFLATDCPSGPAEIVSDRALLMKPNSIDALADGLIRLWHGATASVEQIERSRHRAIAFSSERMAIKWEDLILELRQ